MDPANQLDGERPRFHDWKRSEEVLKSLLGGSFLPGALM
jgi:hypothetical protein